MLEIIDTFPAYLEYWEHVKDLSMDEQINAWKTGYLKPWPDLLEIQIEDYKSQSLDWKKIAQENVFPYLADRYPAMQLAHQNLIELIDPIFEKVERQFPIDYKVNIVIYIGIGCGAGWVTTYHQTPAILFGLENIAECGWSDQEAISGLVAHEIGHLIHYQTRKQNGKTNGIGSWWQLYSEGFAQYFEGLILDSDRWHQTMGEDKDWLRWCQENKMWLAAEFLRRVDTGESTKSFFGSWFDISGKSQTGYYLGYEMIKEIEKSLSLEDIALIEDIEKHARPLLQQISAVG